MAGEYVEFVNNSQPALNEDNLNLMQQLIKKDIQSTASGDTLPIGAIVPFGSDTIPENWLLCNGQAVSRTDYQQLFNTIGITFGQGDGFTTFNLPNLQGKVVVGKDGNDTDFDMLGETGGEKEHTLTIDEMPAHTHTGVPKYYRATSVEQETESNSQTGSQGSTSSVGGGQPHNILQPYQVQNYIIKARQSAGVVATVVDSLNSTSTTDALSANQGRLLKGLTLFENASGLNTDITLSETAANFDYIEIFYAKDGNTDGYASIRIFSPNGKKANANSTKGSSNNTITFYNSEFLISGTSITLDSGKSIAFSNTGTVQGFSNTGELKIYKVIGYK